MENSSIHKSFACKVNMFFFKSLIAFFFTTLIFPVAVFSAPPEEGGAKILDRDVEFLAVPTQVKIQLGKVSASEVYEIKLKARNRSGDSFKPNEVVSSCSCAAAVVSKDEIAAGDVVDVKIRLAVPKVEGEFRRQVRLVESLDRRIDILMEGVSEAGFECSTKEFVVDSLTDSLIFTVKPRRDAIKDGTFELEVVSGGVSQKRVTWSDGQARVMLKLSEAYSSNTVTIVVKGESEGRRLSQEFELSVRERRRLLMKPKHLKFEEVNGQLVCKFFIYGEMSDLAGIDLSKARIVVSSEASTLVGVAPKGEEISLSVSDLEKSEHGIAGLLVAETAHSKGARAFGRICFGSGAFLDQTVVVTFD